MSFDDFGFNWDTSWMGMPDLNTGLAGGPDLITPPVIEPVAPPPVAGPIQEQTFAKALIETAKRIGADPVDLATVISYETGGKFDPALYGGAGGRHMGLIQFGPAERAQYGAHDKQTAIEQLTAVENYLKDRGFKPGMNIMDLYSTINAGRPGLYNRSDANNGGAPGTVADKVNNQMASHRVRAAQLLNGLISPEALSRSANRQVLANNPLVAPPKQSLSQIAQQGGLGPQAQQDELKYARAAGITSAQPPVPPDAGVVPASSAAAELQAMLDEESGAVSPMPVIAAPPPAITTPVTAAAPTFLERIGPLAKRAGGALWQAGKDIADADRQFTSQAMGTIAALPSSIGSSLAAIPSVFGSDAGKETASYLDELSRFTKGMYEESVAGGEKPDTAIEHVGAAAGRQAAIPGGLAMTGAFTLADLASQHMSGWFMPSAEAAPKKFSKQELTSMGMTPTAGANAQLPGPRKPVVTHNGATWLERMAALSRPADVGPIDTPAGPTTLPGASIKLLGYSGIATLGMMVAPWVVRKVGTSMSQLPAFDPSRPVHGGANVTALSTAGDLARVYDDVNSPLIRIGRRAGIPHAELTQLKDGFRIQAGTATRSLVQSAVQNGAMETPSFRFNVRTPLERISMAERADPNFTRYMQNHLMGDILVAQTNVARGAGAPMPRVGGANLGPDVTVNDALTAINNMNRTNPQYRAAFTEFQANIKEGRRFIGDGEFAIEPRGNISLLNRYYESTPVITRGMIPEMLKRVQRGESPVAILEDQFHRKFRARMENEIRGQYVDAMKGIESGKYMRQVDAEWVKNHPGSNHTLVKIYRRGKPEYYSTDPLLASVLKSDPYYAHTIADGILYSSKRLFESTTTGALAPFFAATNLYRTQQIALFGSIGAKKPMPWDLAAAIPRQYVPAMSKSIADSLNYSSGGWLGSVLGPQNMQQMSNRLQRVYDNSFYAQLARVGGHQGSFMKENWTDMGRAMREQSRGMTQVIGDVLPSLPPGSWSRTFLDAWVKMIDSTHNAAAFAYASKNRGSGTLPEVAQRARNLTGDPTITGQFLTGPMGEQFRYQPRNAFDSVVAGAVRTYGAATEAGRIAVPWWNITTQGMKRIGRAYIDNPVKFMTMVYGTQVLPTAAMYMYVRGLNPNGDNRDPNGVKYIDYLMDGRSEYDRSMNLWIPLEGRPVADGIRMPWFHEMSMANHLTLHAMDQAFGRSAYTPGEAFNKVARSFVGLMDPPVPPAINFGMASFGMGTAQGGILSNTIGRPLGIAMTGSPFGGEAYKKKTDPYDQLGGLDGTLELQARALMPGLADIFAAGATSFLNADEATSRMEAGLKGATRRYVEKTPGLRDIIGWQPPVSGNTVVAEELYAKSKAISGLMTYFKQNIENEGAIRIKPRSNEGGVVTHKYLGPGLPPAGDVAPEYYSRSDKRTGAVKGAQKSPEWANSPGVYQPEPSNPLFKEFAAAVLTRFEKDKPSEGGFGYRSLWQRHRQWTEAVQKLNKINDGNLVTWQRDLAAHPEWLESLKANNVDPSNPRAVRNFFNHKRQETAKVILNSIKAVEQQFSEDPRVKMLTGGKPFKLEMIDPYGGLAQDVDPTAQNQ